MTTIGLVGAGGFARAVMPVLRRQCARDCPDATLRFIDEAPPQAFVNGVPCVTPQEFLGLPDPDKRFNVAIGDSQTRERIAVEFTAAGLTPWDLVSPSAEVFDDNDIGAGVLLCGFSTVTSNITIGRFFHLNIYSYVGHDSVVGDYVTFGPRVSCNGNVRVGDHAYIGAGAVIRNGTAARPLVIGDRAVVGMGAIVTKDVPAGATVVGNPARLVSR